MSGGGRARILQIMPMIEIMALGRVFDLTACSAEPHVGPELMTFPISWSAHDGIRVKQTLSRA